MPKVTATATATSKFTHAPVQACPCGALNPTKKPLALADCCARYLDNFQANPAPDALSLMRSRYSAFVLSRTDYLLATWHTTTRPGTGQAVIDPNTRWLGLAVRRHTPTGTGTAEVEFVARWRTSRSSGPATRMHERSRFLYESGRWYYLDGEML